jgi:hypothetical protein
MRNFSLHTKVQKPITITSKGNHRFNITATFLITLQ